MSRFVLLIGLAMVAVGCQSDPQVKNNPETPKPTQAQLDAMPPQAAKHAAEMSDYAKAQSQMNAGHVAPPKK